MSALLAASCFLVQTLTSLVVKQASCELATSLQALHGAERNPEPVLFLQAGTLCNRWLCVSSPLDRDCDARVVANAYGWCGTWDHLRA